MIQKPKPFSMYQSDILAALQEVGVKQLSPGGKARAFADVIASTVGQVESRDFNNLAQTLVPYALGENLDFLCEIWGVRRLGRQDAKVRVADANFKFFVRRGTFGAINGGNDIVIPAGTRIFTASEDGPVYVVAADVTLFAGLSEVYFSANSLGAGALGKAAAEAFNRHNFSNYTDSKYGSLLVVNNYGVDDCQDEEDDENLRYRLSLKLESQGGGREAELRFELLNLAGIQDAVFERQAGSYLVYVYGTSPTTPPTLLQAVQEILNSKTAYPMTGLAVAPDLVGVSCSTTVRLSKTVTSADRSGVLNAAAQAAQNYIDNLRVGETMVINEIADRIRDASPVILDTGEVNKPLSEVFIWRSRADGSRYSRYLVRNYTPARGERIVTENISNAINLTQV